MSKLSVRFSVSFSEETAEKLRQHSDYKGSLPDLVRALALEAIGEEPPDISAAHRETLAKARESRHKKKD